MAFLIEMLFDGLGGRSVVGVGEVYWECERSSTAWSSFDAFSLMLV